MVGGSQPEGYLLDQDTSWPGALQHLLATPEHLATLGASKVHVGNIARSGVGSDALDRVLAHVLPRYPRLQAIVILVGASDTLRWLEQGAPPTPPAPAATQDIFRWHPEGPFGWKVGNSAAVDLLLRMRRRWLQPVEVHQRTGAWIGRARGMRARARVVRTTTPDPTRMLDHFEIHLRKVIERARAHADRVLVVRQSWFGKDSYTAEEAAHMWHGGVGQAWREEVTTYYSLDVTCRLMADLDRVAARVASELDVEQVDLMPILDRSLRTYYDFFHLTPGGAATAAGAVASILLRQSVVSREAVPRAQGLGTGKLEYPSEPRAPSPELVHIFQTPS